MKVIADAEKRADAYGVGICDAEYCIDNKCAKVHYHLFGCGCADCIEYLDDVDNDYF